MNSSALKPIIAAALSLISCKDSIQNVSKIRQMKAMQRCIANEEIKGEK